MKSDTQEARERSHRFPFQPEGREAKTTFFKDSVKYVPFLNDGGFHQPRVRRSHRKRSWESPDRQRAASEPHPGPGYLKDTAAKPLQESMEKREKYTVIVPVNNYKPGQFELEMRYKHGRTEQLLSLQRTVEEEKHLISGWRTFIDEDKNLHQAERSKVPFVEVEENLERSRCQLETS